MSTADPRVIGNTGEPSSMPPVPHLQPLAPLIGRWRTSGTVLDEHGADAATISGLDTSS